MEIRRSGTHADHGTSTVTMPDLAVTWRSDSKRLQLQAEGVRDFNTKATHNYSVDLSLSDLSKALKVLAEAATSDPEIVEKGLGKEALRSVGRLQAVLLGLRPG